KFTARRPLRLQSPLASAIAYRASQCEKTVNFCELSVPNARAGATAGGRREVRVLEPLSQPKPIAVDKSLGLYRQCSGGQSVLNTRWVMLRDATFHPPRRSSLEPERAAGRPTAAPRRR